VSQVSTSNLSVEFFAVTRGKPFSGENDGQSELERLFLRQKKSTTFFHARISRSGKG
jgi:hypothetical protein